MPGTLCELLKQLVERFKKKVSESGGRELKEEEEMEEVRRKI